jgi:SAM-dependent methyltransferase
MITPQGGKMENYWINFWNRTDITEWQKDLDYCLHNIFKEFSFEVSDSVMDLGCGNGYFASKIAPYVNHITGLDTSETTINYAREQYQNRNMSFLTIPADKYTEIDKLTIGTEGFLGMDYIFAVSVLQYYKSIDEIRELIKNLKKIANKNCKLIFIDLLVDYNFIVDCFGAFFGAFKNGTLFNTVKVFGRFFKNSYGKTRKEHKLLTFNRNELEQVCKEESVALFWSKHNYNINCNRKTAIITL